MDVCGFESGFEAEEVEEGGVVHGGRGPRRGDSREIGAEAVCEEGVRENAGAQRGKSSGEDFILFIIARRETS